MSSLRYIFLDHINLHLENSLHPCCILSPLLRACTIGLDLDCLLCYFLAHPFILSFCCHRPAALAATHSVSHELICTDELQHRPATPYYLAHFGWGYSCLVIISMFHIKFWSFWSKKTLIAKTMSPTNHILNEALSPLQKN